MHLVCLEEVVGYAQGAGVVVRVVRLAPSLVLDPGGAGGECSGVARDRGVGATHGTTQHDTGDRR